MISNTNKFPIYNSRSHMLFLITIDYTVTGLIMQHSDTIEMSPNVISVLHGTLSTMSSQACVSSHH